MTPRTLYVRPVLNGFVVEVGCQAVVFNDLAEMLEQIGLYYKDPARLEELYLKNALNQVYHPEPPVEATPRPNYATLPVAATQFPY